MRRRHYEHEGWSVTSVEALKEGYDPCYSSRSKIQVERKEDMKLPKVDLERFGPPVTKIEQPEGCLFSKSEQRMLDIRRDWDEDIAVELPRCFRYFFWPSNL